MTDPQKNAARKLPKNGFELMIYRITHERMMRKDMSLGLKLFYLIDIFTLLFVWFFYEEFGGLIALSGGAARVSVYSEVLRILTVISIYSVRVSSYIAIIRKNRMPQTIEWLVTAIGVPTGIIFMIFGGWMLLGYATLHGYQYCYDDPSNTANWIFVKHPLSCPPVPATSGNE